MKNTLLIFMLKTSIFLAVLSGCQKADMNEASYPYHEVLKQIMQINCTIFSTGLNSLFRTTLTDSTEMASFCQKFLSGARFLDEGSGYLFVESLSGYSIAHPLQPGLQGTATLNLTDVNGKYFVKNMIDIVNHTGYGFLKYFYMNPSKSKAESKTTFVSRIPNSNWYAGAGFFYEGNEPYFSNSQKSEKEVTEAVKFIGKGIAAILPSFAGDSLAGVLWMRSFLRDMRFFEDRSGYFFVLDYRGYNVVQPPEPSREGNYQWNIQDTKGNFLMQGLIAKAKAGGGFYSYYWMDYQTNTEKLKNAFVIPIEGINYLIGSGVYYPD